MIVDSTSEKHHTATSIDSDDLVVLLRSRVGHYDGVLWDIITTTTTRTGRGACGGGHRGDMPQLFIIMVDSTSEKHHTVIHVDSGDLVVTYSSLIHYHHEKISNTCHMWVWWHW